MSVAAGWTRHDVSNQVIYTDPSVRVYHADATDLTRVVDDNSIDLTVTSPPYHVNIPYDQYNDLEGTYEQYLEWSAVWIEELYRKTKIGGRFCLNVPLDSVVNKSPMFLDLATIARKVGWNYRVSIAWDMLESSQGAAMRGSWLSAAAPFVVPGVEMITTFYKGPEWSRSKTAKGRTSTLAKKQFIAWTRNIWRFGYGSTRRNEHPAAFPLVIPSRCIQLFSFKEDFVFDPFVGSGTTLVAAKLLGRTGVGTDISLDYCRLSGLRCQRILPFKFKREDLEAVEETSVLAAAGDEEFDPRDLEAPEVVLEGMVEVKEG